MSTDTATNATATVNGPTSQELIKIIKEKRSKPTTNASKSTKKSKGSKPSKWAQQRAKRKKRRQRKKARKEAIIKQAEQLKETRSRLNEYQSVTNEIDYISDTLSETAQRNFGAAFERFTRAEDLFKTKEELLKEAAEKEKAQKQKLKDEEEKKRKQDPIEAAMPSKDKKNGMDVDGDEEKEENVVSNKQRKLRDRPSIAQLKKGVIRSDLVEEHDVNASDPYLLIELKSMRNTIPVPGHWLQKRKYLQGKRGFVKPPFKLPSYIEATGITKMRDNRLSLLSDKSTKQKQREKVRPKTGGLEISYEKLHAAFFNHQTKPDDLTGFGDIYFEGREQMNRFSRFKAGFVSDNLKKALSMSPRYRVVCPAGVMVKNQRMNEETEDIEWYDVQQLKYGQYVVWDEMCGPKRIKISAPISGYVWLSSRDGKEELLKRCDVEDPPPWLINMQRFGPPPSYPDLKIAGLNSPIPTHKMYGFHEGQWGKPPVDENGQPLYGDPFGIWTEPISKSWGAKMRWGILEKFDETESEEESDSDEEDEEEQDIDMASKVQPIKHSAQRPVMANGKEDLSGILSNASSVPSTVNLRKDTTVNKNMNGIMTPSSTISTQEHALYQVLQPAEHTVRGKFGSSTVYKIPSFEKKTDENEPPAKKQKR